MSRVVALLLFGFALILGMAYTLVQRNAPALPAETRIFSDQLRASTFKLRNLTLGGSGRAYGSQGDTLYRIGGDGQRVDVVNAFDARISAIHERHDGLLIVATDSDHWDPLKPCRVYRSLDGGESFELVKQIDAGSLLGWSVASDSAGRLYLAEYGPQRQGMSKTLWRSGDDGASWEAVYQAPDRDKVHLHRIAVDPYTDHLWLTRGDGANRAMLISRDHGNSWREVEPMQATAVAFGEAAIYWGRDRKGKPGVVRYDREKQTFSTWFRPNRRGNFGGSVYDMLMLPDGDLLVPFMKYPDQPHVASVWRGGEDGEWELLMQLASEQGKGTGIASIAGPDLDGWVYMPGYQMRVR